MRRHRLQIESLEQRRMLAGDVTVIVKSGRLLVTGAAGDEAVEITQGSKANTFRIAGLEGTTVNGQVATTPVAFSGVSRGIRIDLGAGENAIALGKAGQEQTVAPAVSVNGGVGDDSITITNTRVRGTLAIETNAGRNRVNLLNTSVAGDVVIGTMLYPSSDEDTIEIGGMAITGRLQYRSGARDQSVSIADTRVGGDVRITMLYENSDEETISLAVVSMAKTRVGRGLTIESKALRTTLSLAEISVTRDVAIKVTPSGTSAGATSDVRIRGTPTTPTRVGGRTTLESGSGADAVRIEDVSLVGPVTVALGDGADALTFARVGVALPKLRRIDGGGGTDSLASDRAIGTNNAIFRNWESFGAV